MVPGRNLGLLLAFAGALVARPVPAVEVNRIVLRVNERILTLYDYEVRRNERVRALRSAQLPPDRLQAELAEVGVGTLRSLFEELLLLSRADQLGIEASPDEIATSIERAKSSFGIQSEEEFEQALVQSGLTRQSLREQTARNISVQKVIGREIRPRVAVSEEDLRRYYQTHPEEFAESASLNLREIVLLEDSGVGSAELTSMARDLRAKVAAGEPVDEDLERYRQQGLATSWIEHGWVRSGDLDDALERAVWELAEDEVSEPVPGRGGLHLIQVLERKEARQLSFNEAQDRIYEIESDRVFASEMQKYLSELEDASYIVSRPPPEAAEFRASVPRSVEDPMAELDRSLAGAGSEPATDSPPPTESSDAPPDGV